MGVRKTYNLRLFRLGVPLLDSAEPAIRPYRLFVPDLGKDIALHRDGNPQLGSLLHEIERPTLAKVIPFDESRMDKTTPQETVSPETVYLLPAGFWPHDGPARRSITTYVDPTDPHIQSLCPPQAGSQNAPDLLTDFSDCVGRFEPIYGLPEKRTHRNGATSQHIPTPTEIMSTNSGSCLDLALFLAAVHEAKGGAPLLIFSGPADGFPDHAFVAQWIRNRPELETEEREILSHDELRGAVLRGDLVAVEATELARGRSRNAERASQIGRQFILDHVCHAVDISAVRNAAGESAAPGRMAYGPIVWSAELLASQIAATEGRRQRETSHLLQALAELESPLLVQIFGMEIVSRLKSEGRLDVAAEDILQLRSTGGYVAALIFAKAYSHQYSAAHPQPAISVRECHLLLALLQSPRASTRRAIVEAGGSPRRALAELLAIPEFKTSPNSSPGFQTTGF